MCVYVFGYQYTVTLVFKVFQTYKKKKNTKFEKFKNFKLEILIFAIPKSFGPGGDRTCDLLDTEMC